MKNKQEMEWIPCRERMPEADGEYIVTYCVYRESYGVTEMTFSTDKVRGKTVKRWHWHNYISTCEVIAWMPLPDPYMRKTQ
ncbi:hypothetical protein HMPREF1986_00329 [Oribacterium sp. oral taxon 078 str. F0263]|uniref:DUF551 domain-containing protein n=1 Tax=Oribacterium sp. oral taxon 078 TaxID=652706 RepID=UPI0003AE7AB1|nr:DUF551 domain-containing protein [Oribacterium sp. oral taxon 078]ERL22718.1 hypothetical protein HMPREF1986_00329 [Oribacterium sp. oral taxon 078 str. F0263]